MTETKKHFCCKCGKETSTFYKITKIGAEPWVSTFYTIGSVTVPQQNISIVVVPDALPEVVSTVNGTVWGSLTSNSSFWNTSSYQLGSIVGTMKNEDEIIIELCTECMKDIIADILVVQNL